MFRGNFIATLLLLPFIFQLFLLSNVVGIDPNLSDPPIPPDLTQNGTSADTAPSPIPILMDNEETSGNGPSGNATSLENAKNVDKKAENQPTTAFGDVLSGNTASLENAEVVGKMAEDQPIIVSENEPSGNATTLENAENVGTGIMTEDKPTNADNSLLTRMLGMDEKQERSIEKEVEENQRQVMDDGTMDSSVEEGEKERKRVPLQANADGGADQNANGNENKVEDEGFVAYDWAAKEEQKQLTQADADKTALIAVPLEGADDYKIIFQAKVPGATIPIRLRFEDENECSISGGYLQNVIYFQLKICERPPKEDNPPNPSDPNENDDNDSSKGKKCDKDVFICYPGKMDPLNLKDNDNDTISDLFALPNVEKHKEIVQKCKEQLEKDEEWKKQWAGKEMHAIKIHQNADGNFEVTASFSEKPQILKPMNDHADDRKSKGCAFLYMGEENSLFGTHRDEKSYQKDEGKALEEQKAIVEGLVNGFALKHFDGLLNDGHPLKDLNFVKILPLDLVPRSHDEHVMAFVAPESCNLVIEISGEHLQKCKTQECHSKVEETPGQRKNSFYQKDFSPEYLHPITNEGQLPPFYKRYVTIARPDEQNIARIASTGENEIIFALATKEPIPPKFVAFRPDNAIHCTIRKDPLANEFVLAYNGRPDCFGRLSWGERSFEFSDAQDDTNRFVTIKDMQLTIGEGENEDEFWTVDQYGDKQMMGTATCSVDLKKIPKKMKQLPGMENLNYIWEFILNPKRGNAPLSDPSRCKIGLQFNVDDYTLLLSYEKLKPGEEEKPDDVKEPDEPLEAE